MDTVSWQMHIFRHLKGVHTNQWLFTVSSKDNSLKLFNWDKSILISEALAKDQKKKKIMTKFKEKAQNGYSQGVQHL